MILIIVMVILISGCASNFGTPPVAIKQGHPHYPKELQKERIEGTVWLVVEIFTDGSVGVVEVKKSLHPILDEEAVKAVKKWKFQPAVNAEGEKVGCWVTFPIEFKSFNN